MWDGLIRGFEFEVAHRLNRHRPISSYRSTDACFGPTQRVYCAIPQDSNDASI